MGEPVALKILNKKKIKELGILNRVKREIKIMKKLKHHPHIIYLYEVIDTTSDIFLALELARGGDLYTKMVNQGKVSLKLFKLIFSILFIRLTNKRASASSDSLLAPSSTHTSVESRTEILSLRIFFWIKISRILRLPTSDSVIRCTMVRACKHRVVH